MSTNDDLLKRVAAIEDILMSHDWMKRPILASAILPEVEATVIRWNPEFANFRVWFSYMCRCGDEHRENMIVSPVRSNPFTETLRCQDEQFGTDTLTRVTIRKAVE